MNYYTRKLVQVTLNRGNSEGTVLSLLAMISHGQWREVVVTMSVCADYFTAFSRAFSLTWPASMQIYWNKRESLHKKRVQPLQDWFGTPTWPPFHCFGIPIWSR